MLILCDSLEVNRISTVVSSLMVSPAKVCRGGAVTSWVVRVTNHGSSGPGLCPGRGHCIVLLGKTLVPNSGFLHPGV